MNTKDISNGRVSRMVHEVWSALPYPVRTRVDNFHFHDEPRAAENKLGVCGQADIWLNSARLDAQTGETIRRVVAFEIAYCIKLGAGNGASPAAIERAAAEQSLKWGFGPPEVW